MSEELLFGIGFVGTGLSLAFWNLAFKRRSVFGKTQWISRTLKLTVCTSLILLSLVLWRWADHQVREENIYIVLLTAIGFIWGTVVVLLAPWLGLSLMDDVIEQKNPAALVTFCGIFVGAILIYAGGNIGEGPSLWNNIFSAGVATVVWLLLWFFVELNSRPSLSISEERDVATGIRLAGLLVGLGLILGRSVAGKWESAGITTRDLIRDGWPALILTFISTITEYISRPTKKSPFPSWQTYGVIPSVIYLVLAMGYVAHLGKWK